MAVPEAPLEQTEHGLAPKGQGWFVLNAREASWSDRPGRGARSKFEGLDGEAKFPQLGINIQVIGPGEPMAMYHWEADQEGFLVLSGEALLIVEGEERPLRAWDFFHCPRGTNHIVVGAGDAPCVVLSIGAREHQGRPGWGAYTVEEAALRHGAGVEEETTDPAQASARSPNCERGPYREGWLPG